MDSLASLSRSIVERLSTKLTLVSLVLGQIISLFITGTGVTSQYLALSENVSVPTFQSSLNYWLLFICYFPYLVYLRNSTQSPSPAPVINDEPPIDGTNIEEKRENEELLNSEGSTAQETSKPTSVLETLRLKGWFYLLLAIADVEANFLVVKAYRYTSITSVMLLDCFSIPCVMVLSFIFLKTRFRVVHYMGVLLCLCGLSLLVAADAIYNDHQVGEDPLKGDLLCLAAACLYAISNVGQEGAVKQYDRVEYLAMLGLFGSIINSMQLIILERNELASLAWTPSIVGLLIGFALCLFAVYSLTPYMLQWAGSTMFNLSLLSSDAFAIIVGIFLFNYTPSVFYFVALVIIIVGLVLYNLHVEIPVGPLYQRLSSWWWSSSLQEKELAEPSPSLMS